MPYNEGSRRLIQNLTTKPVLRPGEVVDHRVQHGSADEFRDQLGAQDCLMEQPPQMRSAVAHGRQARIDSAGTTSPSRRLPMIFLSTSAPCFEVGVGARDCGTVMIFRTPNEQINLMSTFFRPQIGDPPNHRNCRQFPPRANRAGPPPPGRSPAIAYDNARCR